jgi:dihydrofolate reductase
LPSVILDMAMSLDGFIAGPNDEDHGLHNYFFSPVGPIRQVIDEGFRTTGTIVMGRRSYEIGALQDSFVDNPYHIPTFIVTHHVPEKVARGAESCIFVKERIESALEQAKAVTGNRDVVIGGGAIVD